MNRSRAAAASIALALAFAHALGSFGALSAQTTGTLEALWSTTETPSVLRLPTSAADDDIIEIIVIGTKRNLEFESWEIALDYERTVTPIFSDSRLAATIGLSRTGLNSASLYTLKLGPAVQKPIGPVMILTGKGGVILDRQSGGAVSGTDPGGFASLAVQRYLKSRAAGGSGSSLAIGAEVGVDLRRGQTQLSLGGRIGWMRGFLAQN